MENANDQATRYAQERLLLTAVRTLLASHPNPAALRDEWAHQLSLMYKHEATGYGLDPLMAAEANAAFQRLQPVWETFLAGSPEANPPSPADE